MPKCFFIVMQIIDKRKPQLTGLPFKVNTKCLSVVIHHTYMFSAKRDIVYIYITCVNHFQTQDIFSYSILFQNLTIDKLTFQDTISS